MTKILMFKEHSSYMKIPMLQSYQICNINDIVLNHAGKAWICPGHEVNNLARVSFTYNQLVLRAHILTEDRSSSHDAAVTYPEWSNHAALSPEENWRFVEHDTARDITDSGCRGFVPFRGTVKV